MSLEGPTSKLPEDSNIEESSEQKASSIEKENHKKLDSFFRDIVTGLQSLSNVDRHNTEKKIDFLKSKFENLDKELISKVFNSSYKNILFSNIDNLDKSLGNHGASGTYAKEIVFGTLTKEIENKPSSLFLENFKTNEVSFESLGAVEGSVKLFAYASQKIKDSGMSAMLAEIEHKNIALLDTDWLVLHNHMAPKSMAFLTVYINEEEQEKIKKSILKVLNEKISYQIDHLLSSIEIISKNSEMVIRDEILLKQFGLKDFDFKKAWLASIGRGLQVGENLITMEELEATKPGSVKMLFEKYGIMEFERYPVEVLRAQVEQDEVDQPYGVVIYPRADHNGAFDNQKKTFEKMFQDLHGKYGMRICECESKFDLARKLATMNSRYGEKNKISFMIMGGHGSGAGLELGGYDFNVSYKDQHNDTNRKTLWNVEFENPGFKKANQKFFDKDAEIIFFSCSVGESGGLAEAASSAYEKTTHAPAVPVSQMDVTTSFDENGKPHFEVLFKNKEKDENISMTYKKR